MTATEYGPHLGRGHKPGERLVPYRPKYDHADIDRLLDEEIGSSRKQRVVFHHPETLTLDIADDVPLPDAGNAVRAYGKITTAGTGTTTCDVLLNGDIVATLSFTSATPRDLKLLAHPYPADSAVAVETTAIATGAAGLVVVYEHVDD